MFAGKTFGYRMSKTWSAILFLAAIACTAALISMRGSDGDAVKVAEDLRISDVAAKWNKHTIDSAISLLRSGNVVLRMGMGAQSQLLAQMNRGNKSYSHCGIVLVEKGYPFVYHCIGGEDNPDSRLRRDSATRFFSAAHNAAIAIVSYPIDTIKERNVVQEFYHLRPRFDLQFDLATDDRLYCTEFVYKVLAKTTADTSYIPTTTVMGRRFIGTDNLYTNSHASLVWQVKFK